MYLPTKSEPPHHNIFSSTIHLTPPLHTLCLPTSLSYTTSSHLSFFSSLPYHPYSFTLHPYALLINPHPLSIIHFYSFTLSNIYSCPLLFPTSSTYLSLNIYSLFIIFTPSSISHPSLLSTLLQLLLPIFPVHIPHSILFTLYPQTFYYNYFYLFPTPLLSFSAFSSKALVSLCSPSLVRNLFYSVPFSHTLTLHFLT